MNLSALRTPSAVTRLRRCIASLLGGVALLSVHPAAAISLSTPITANYFVPPGLYNGQYMGDSVAISGGFMVAGSSGAKKAGVATGGVYVFNASTGAYVRTIFPSDGLASDQFGISVAISGNVLAVGANRHVQLGASRCGAVYLYNLTTGALIRRLDPPPAAIQANAEWGGSVAIEGDMVVMGARYFDGIAGANTGGVLAYRISTNAFSNLVTGAAAGDELGTSVALWRGMAACGAPMANATDGQVLLLEASDLSMLQHTVVSDSLPAGHHGEFGSSVAMDAERLIVGAPLNAAGGVDAGRVVLVDLTDMSSPTAYASANGTAKSFLGSSVSAKGRMFAVGAPSWGNVLGAVYVYGESLTLIDSLLPAATKLGDYLGNAVALARDGTLVAAAYGFDSTAYAGGAIWRAGPYLQNQSRDFYTHSRSGDAAPGSTLCTFASFPEICAPYVSSSIGVTHTSTLSGTGAASGKNKGLWSTVRPAALNAPGFISRVNVPTGLGPFESPLVTLTNLTRPISSHRDYLFFRGSKTTGTSLLSFDATNYVIEIIAAGQPVVVGGPVALTFYEGRAANDLSYFVQPMKLKTGTGTPAVTAASDSALAIISNSVVIGIAREGVTTSPAPGAPLWGELAPRVSVADTGNIMVSGFVQTAPATSIVMLNSTAIASVGDTATDSSGNPIPGNPITSPKFSAFLGEGAMSGSSGHHAIFRATLKTDAGASVSTANNEGLWIKLGAGPVRLAARKGDLIGSSGLSWLRFIDFGINGYGDVLVLAQVKGIGVTAANDVALVNIYDANPANAEVLLREGSVAPGCDGARISTINLVDMAFKGGPDEAYGVLATLVVEPGGATAGNNLVWLSGDLGPGSAAKHSYRMPSAHLRKGERHASIPGRDTITSIAFPATLRDATGAGNTGMAHVMNYTQDVNAVITFGDRSSALVTRFR